VTTRDELEAQIAAAPTDDAAYVILGDLLQLDGDPRGELIAIDAAAASGGNRGVWNRRRIALLERYPELAPAEQPGLHFTWHLGFVRRVTIDTSHELDVLDHPALRFATEVVFLDPRAADHDARKREHWVTITRRLPLLRSLGFGDPDRRHYHYPRDRSVFDLSMLHLPRLEQLYSCEPVQLGTAAPWLRTLRLEGDPDVLVRLQEQPLPALERLSLRDGITRQTSPRDRMRWLFDHPPPRLVDLELIGSEGDELVEAMVGTALLAQLRRLRLWNAGITTVGAGHLQRGFGHLELLDLSDPLIDEEVIPMVSGVCREVRTISPWMREIIRRG